MLRCASVLAAEGIAARAGAKRRDRMLGLDDWVHLSTNARTPLLADKIRRGYPHALLVFDGPATLASPGVALLPQNTKAWRARAAFAPVSDLVHQARLMDEHLRRGRHPSLEILVQYALGLDTLSRIVLIDAHERDLLSDMITTAGIRLGAPLSVEPELFPGGAAYTPRTLGAVSGYFDLSRAAGRVLPPPVLPFD